MCTGLKKRFVWSRNRSRCAVARCKTCAHLGCTTSAAKRCLPQQRGNRSGPKVPTAKLPNCQIANSQHRSEFLHNFHGQQEQSFLHRLYKNLDCGVAEIHCILSEIDHSLPLPPAWPSARLPYPPGSSRQDLLQSRRGTVRKVPTHI